jgi:hypothetical protein
MYLCVRGIDSASFYDFSIGFWTWSDSVVSFCFSFYKVSERDWNSIWKPKRFVLASAFILIYLSILLHNIANQNCISYFEKYWLVVYFDQLFNLMIDLIFGVWRHFQQYFSYIMATSFSGGRSRSIRRESPTMCKQLVNFITYGSDSSAPFL